MTTQEERIKELEDENAKLNELIEKLHVRIAKASDILDTVNYEDSKFNRWFAKHTPGYYYFDLHNCYSDSENEESKDEEK